MRRVPAEGEVHDEPEGAQRDVAPTGGTAGRASSEAADARGSCGATEAGDRGNTLARIGQVQGPKARYWGCGEPLRRASRRCHRQPLRPAGSGLRGSGVAFIRSALSRRGGRPRPRGAEAGPGLSRASALSGSQKYLSSPHFA